MIAKLLAAITKKKAANSTLFGEKPKVRIDESWPLGIKLGRTVVLEQTPFLLADNSEVKFPGEDNVIKAVGIAEPAIAEGVKVFRIYLQKVAGEEESVLQISVDKKTDEVLESILYRLAWEIFPASSEEVALWMNEENGMLGWKDMKTPTENKYERVTPFANKDMVKPFPWREHFTDDPHIANILHIDYGSVVYGRELNEQTTEYLLVSKVEEEGSTSIKIYAGITIDSGFIKIL
ncbi:hypothetical protein A2333_03065 [Candidatus Wolfebacteria bacterium RIFOXYB2_FULL_49_7]|uniref:DUF2491 domain-containing protein n=2 Tax=Candidatus Wolfeibacteriota TaxID=1752735 RepID=A0A1F8DY33_9BACT|nr:MAG: hypothetical protein A2372_03560 [Candidatus Wolfebacteria bacterium RIFOXYB1_FULL_54_12]OGM93801.1 MAG: hypothetical protein A2333_03065 [Candidatus Wolfebacteria bacterium RIFOXYB2_FULL_49_7]OGM95321.1 MAG: hypothetical protein A2524_04600 [Candidatus Wolfebacteria bacterium RIFOXYD12_FULL_48_21]OGM95658.1 MAG: hypothetical protein A2610_02450 [Candidatus Wolfebacteria bacterium RIFOXYD1_FULL_48_65]OGM96758.1 MAG: hypothetical protein A2532_04210 [Candidatus Wolfebacteria bacterium RI